MLICQYMCYCCRPGSIRADAFRGHGLSLLEKTTLRGLRTRAIPAGVTALLSPGLVMWLMLIFVLVLMVVNAIPAKKNTETSVGAEA